jgi:hypothetical protein
VSVVEGRLSRPLNQYEIVNAAEAAINRRTVQLNAQTGERPLSVDQRAELVAAQKHASAVFDSLSLGTPSPHRAEAAFPYRVRLASLLQHHHPDWARVDLAAVARSNPGAFSNAESAIYSAARARGLDPEYRGHAPEGTLRERVATEPDGLKISYFHGDIRDMLAPFTGRRSLAVKSFGPRFAGRR